MRPRAPRAAWLHVIRDADPDYPWRGVSPLQRASVSSQLARMAEDALVTEMRQPTMALIPLPQGAAIDTATLRNDIQSKAHPGGLPDHDSSRVRRGPLVRTADGLEAATPQADARCRAGAALADNATASASWRRSGRTRPSWAVAAGTGVWTERRPGRCESKSCSRWRGSSRKTPGACSASASASGGNRER